VIHPHSQHNRRRAGVVVEMAVISVVCLTFMFAIFEYGRVVMMQQIMENASRAGARAAVVTATSYVTPATATANVDAVINSQLAGVKLTKVAITLYQADDTGNNIGLWTSTPFGQNIVVKIDADCPNLFPTWGFLPNSSSTTPNAVHLTAITMMRGEAN
jgi:Flp pilus assembly protein TadG